MVPSLNSLCVGKTGSTVSCVCVCDTTSVVDPYSFFTDLDPDPEFAVGDQYGSRALMTKNWKKITAKKKIKFFFDQKLQFTYP